MSSQLNDKIATCESFFDAKWNCDEKKLKNDERKLKSEKRRRIDNKYRMLLSSTRWLLIIQLYFNVFSNDFV